MSKLLFNLKTSAPEYIGQTMFGKDHVSDQVGILLKDIYFDKNKFLVNPRTPGYILQRQTLRGVGGWIPPPL